jgi:hypothetical protein
MRCKAPDAPQCVHCKRQATLQRAGQSRRHSQFFMSGYLDWSPRTTRVHAGANISDQ